MTTSTRRRDRQLRFWARTETGDVPVEGVEVAPGLAVHPGTDGGWTITHVHSGRAIVPGLARARAFELARRIEDFADWSQPAELLDAAGTLQGRVSAEVLRG